MFSPSSAANSLYSEYEPPTEKTPSPTQAAARIMAHHHPGVPNLGDITKVDWHRAPGRRPHRREPVLRRRHASAYDGLIPIEGVDVGDHVWTHEALASGNRHDGARRANRRVPSGVLLDAGSPFLAAHLDACGTTVDAPTTGHSGIPSGSRLNCHKGTTRQRPPA